MYNLHKLRHKHSNIETQKGNLNNLSIVDEIYFLKKYYKNLYYLFAYITKSPIYTALPIKS